jgi:uncharacterized protein (DUF1499 family)
MSEVIEPTKWTTRWAQLAAGDGIGAVMLALLGSFGTGFGLWHFELGFVFVGVAMILALLAIVAAMIALLKGRGTNLAKGGIWLGLICALGFLGVMGNLIYRGAHSPMIHDITTNLAAPPTFIKLHLRDDNLVGVGSQQKWRELHAESYSSIGPLYVKAPQTEVMRRIKSLVSARGWDIALETTDRVEATDTSTAFRFKDDVVILVTPTEGGKVSQVDMRSVSRVGIGDLGVNAKRIRAFLADLTAGKGR